VEKANAERRQEAKNRQMGEGDQASGYCGSLKGAAGPRRDLITQRRLPTRLSRRGIRTASGPVMAPDAGATCGACPVASMMFSIVLLRTPSWRNCKTDSRADTPQGSISFGRRENRVSSAINSPCRRVSVL
jgi:hypothetical protein